MTGISTTSVLIDSSIEIVIPLSHSAGIVDWTLLDFET